MSAFAPLTPDVMVRAIQSSDDGIYVTDREGTILYANKAILSITGHSESSFVGQKTSVFKSGQTSAAYYQRLWRTILSGSVWREVIVHRRASGELYEASQTITPVRDSSGDIGYMIAVQRDISRQSELARELTRTRTEIERLLAEQETLVKEMRHRLKNDVELVRALIELQAGEATTAEAKAELELAAQRVGVLSRTYRLLHESAAERTTPLSDLIRTLADQWNLSIGPMKLSILADDAPVDGRKAVAIGMIANELVTNAVKYAGDGTVTVSATLGDDGAIVLSVHDSGPGFPDSVLTGTAEGFGLRLIRALADQHAGSIVFSNEAGAVAVVRLPG